MMLRCEGVLAAALKLEDMFGEEAVPVLKEHCRGLNVY